MKLYPQISNIKASVTAAENLPQFTSRIPAKVPDIPQIPKSEGFNEYFSRLSEMFKKSPAGKKVAGTIEAVFESTKPEDHFKALKVLKAENGEPLYNMQELTAALSVRRIQNVEITAKDTFAMATSGMSKKDVLYTLGKIMTKEDLEAVRIMTKADGISVAGGDVERLRSRYKFTAFDIQDVRMLLMESKDKQKTLKFLKELIDNNYNNNQFIKLMLDMNGVSPAKSDGDCLIKILRTFKTPEQMEVITQGIKNIG